MALAAQLYAPLEGSVYERSLYIWLCGRADCIGTKGRGRAARCHLMNEEYIQPVQAKEPKQTVKPTFETVDVSNAAFWLAFYW